MKFLSYCIFLCFAFSCVNAQRNCGTEQYLQKQRVADANFTTNVFPNSVTSVTRDTLTNEIITIPVVVHVLYNSGTENISDAQVNSQIDVLNKDYRMLNADKINAPAAFALVAADVRISFCLARVDGSGRPTSGIIHKYTSQTFFSANDEMKFSSSGGDDAWDSKKYLNIWVCNMSGRLLGYATLPGTAANKDGLVIQHTAFGISGTAVYPFNKGRTATHEIGHWLGLQHTWGDTNCGDDGIADTPPQKTYNNGCPSFPHTSSCSINGNGDMFMNFMEFTDDGCMNIFTQGQKIKMRSLFAAGSARNSFLLSNVCDSAAAQGGPLPVDPVVAASVKLYPNPAVNSLIIEGNKTADIAGKTIRIYNTLGRELMVRTLQSQKNSIDISQLPSGIFIIKIEGSVTMKFVKR